MRKKNEVVFFCFFTDAIIIPIFVFGEEGKRSSTYCLFWWQLSTIHWRQQTATTVSSTIFLREAYNICYCCYPNHCFFFPPPLPPLSFSIFRVIEHFFFFLKTKKKQHLQTNTSWSLFSTKQRRQQQKVKKLHLPIRFFFLFVDVDVELLLLLV